MRLVKGVFDNRQVAVFFVFSLAVVLCGCQWSEGSQGTSFRVSEPERAGMVYVPPGAFWRGCSTAESDSCDGPEKPGREITLDGFFIDRTEVTVEAYGKCVQDGSCDSSNLALPIFRERSQDDWAWACNWGKAGREKHPINCLTWSQAQAFCQWADKRLPSEAEWEKAARGTDGRKYAWGNEEYSDLARSGRLVANVADESEKKRDPRWRVADGYDDGHVGTAPVGSFPKGQSPYGALDMTGNVLEWVADFHDDDYYARSPSNNPTGPTHGHERMARGGSWYGEPETTRISLRWPAPNRRLVAVGVRCAAQAEIRP